jgi:hypothetical protein
MKPAILNFLHVLQCDPDSSEEELGPDMEYMESYGRAKQRRRRLARATSHGDGRASA